MKVIWDEYSQHMEKHVPNHQPVFIFIYIYSMYFHIIHLVLSLGKHQERSGPAANHLVIVMVSPVFK
jgi:hypothetical protein